MPKELTAEPVRLASDAIENASFDQTLQGRVQVRSRKFEPHLSQIEHHILGDFGPTPAAHLGESGQDQLRRRLRMYPLVLE